MGPYYCNGHNNDASITENIMDVNFNDIKNWFEPEDIFVVDRGFRDCLEYLENKGFDTKMPCFLKNKSHHNTVDANYSRIISKIRWVIESANGRLKKWKYFYHVV